MPNDNSPLRPTENVVAAFAAILDALAEHRVTVTALPFVRAVRPGYRDEGDGSVNPALIVAVDPGQQVDAQGIAAMTGVPVGVIEATPDEQLRDGPDRSAMSDFEVLLRGSAVTFRPPRRGSYEPPANASLATIDDQMDVEISASPDVGWTVLRDFLQRGAKKSVTVGIYQFTAPHIYKELRKVMLAAPKASLAICRQPTSEAIRANGNKADDLEGDVIIERLHRTLGPRFDFVRASTGAGAAFTSSYHIKVAVIDEKRLWLSSGNWQSSNQSPFDPIEEPESLPAGYDAGYNREYHAVVEHAELAQVFEKYLDYDRELPGVDTFSTLPDGPDLILPPGVEGVVFAPAERFLPLRLQDEHIRVTPVLTPDNYPDVVADMLETATETIDLQNQYINPNADGNLPEFDRLLKTLLDRAAAGVRIRLLLRDYYKPEQRDMLVAVGFDPSWFRVMKNCHAKLIVVDRKRALVGSHNWSNEGVATNRDASLLFEHDRIAQYLADIFEHDWTKRARRMKAGPQPRVVRPGDTFTQPAVPWSSVYDERPRQPTPLTRAASTSPTSTPGAVSRPGAVSFAPTAAAPLITPSGVHGGTGRLLFKPIEADQLAARIVKAGPPVSPEERELRKARVGESFDLPIGTDPGDIRTAGWAVLWGTNTPASVREALEPLISHRRSQMHERFFREVEVREGETVRAFLTRHKVDFGTQLPARLPYYLCIVAAPDDVSFDFQYGLDLEYAVGRVWFDQSDGSPRVDAFESYAKAIVALENGTTPPRNRSIGYWAPRHAGDPATEASTTYLVTPLVDGFPDLDPVAKRVQAGYDKRIAADATRDALRTWLTDPVSGPGVVFTAGHGMGFDATDPRQRTLQGALLSQDFTGFGSIKREHYFAGEDLDSTSRVDGVAAFLFACFGAGTPRINSYPDDRGQGSEVAPTSFVARLPQTLLERGALGVIGHVDIAWGFSFRSSTIAGPQILPFENVIGGILSGERLGHALRSMNNRAMRLGADLTEMLMPGAAGAPNDGLLVSNWIERNDARAYLLLGDPAAKPDFKAR